MEFRYGDEKVLSTHPEGAIDFSLRKGSSPRLSGLGGEKMELPLRLSLGTINIMPLHGRNGLFLKTIRYVKRVLYIGVLCVFFVFLFYFICLFYNEMLPKSGLLFVSMLKVIPILALLLLLLMSI